MSDIDWKASAEAAEALLKLSFEALQRSNAASGRVEAELRARIADLEARAEAAEALERNRADAARSVWEAALRKVSALLAERNARILDLEAQLMCMQDDTFARAPEEPE